MLDFLWIVDTFYFFPVISLAANIYITQTFYASWSVVFYHVRLPIQIWEAGVSYVPFEVVNYENTTN